MVENSYTHLEDDMESHHAIYIEEFQKLNMNFVGRLWSWLQLTNIQMQCFQGWQVTKWFRYPSQGRTTICIQILRLSRLRNLWAEIALKMRLRATKFIPRCTHEEDRKCVSSPRQASSSAHAGRPWWALPWPICRSRCWSHNGLQPIPAIEGCILRVYMRSYSS